MPITDAQLAAYESRGAVTIGSPFTVEQLDRAEAAWDRLKEGGGRPYDDPDYVDVMQHPFFEELAKKVLRAELWFWVNDVPRNRGAMRILPGSHRPIMEHWSRVLSPDHQAQLPRVHGLRPAPVAETAAAFPEYIPEMSDTPWSEQEPTAAVAGRGQVLVLCSAGLHSAWQNEDSVPRKAMGMSWVAEGVSCGLPKGQRDALMEYFPKLREKLRPERVHIVPEQFDWLFESDYEPKWPETFPPAQEQ